MQVKYFCSIFLPSFSHYLMLWKIVLPNHWRDSCLIPAPVIAGDSSLSIGRIHRVLWMLSELQNAGLSSLWPWAQRCTLEQDLLRLWKLTWWEGLHSWTLGRNDGTFWGNGWRWWPWWWARNQLLLIVTGWSLDGHTGPSKEGKKEWGLNETAPHDGLRKCNRHTHPFQSCSIAF